jgi:hypothetical protein
VEPALRIHEVEVLRLGLALEKEQDTIAGLVNTAVAVDVVADRVQLASGLLRRDALSGIPVDRLLDPHIGKREDQRRTAGRGQPTGSAP